jgi:hypothetical protein
MKDDGRPDWMIDEPLLPLRDTRTKAQKKADAGEPFEFSCLQIVCDTNNELHQAFKKRYPEP